MSDISYLPVKAQERVRNGLEKKSYQIRSCHIGKYLFPPLKRKDDMEVRWHDTKRPRKANLTLIEIAENFARKKTGRGQHTELTNLYKKVYAEYVRLVLDGLLEGKKMKLHAGMGMFFFGMIKREVPSIDWKTTLQLNKRIFRPIFGDEKYIYKVNWDKSKYYYKTYTENFWSFNMSRPAQKLIHTYLVERNFNVQYTRIIKSIKK